MAKFQVGSRFYIYSNNATNPKDRAANSCDILVVVSHGYYQNGSGMTQPEGVNMVSFLCPDDDTNSPYELTQALAGLQNGMSGNGDFYHDRTNTSGSVKNYTLTKDGSSDAKKNFKGKASYEFCDSSYIQSIYSGTASYDIIGIHNTGTSGRTVKLADLFKALNDNCPNVYKRVYCGFCRESEMKYLGM